MLSAVKDIGLEPSVDPETFTRTTMVLPCCDPTSGIRVNLILSFSPYEREAIGRAGEVTMGTARVRFTSVEDLIIHKVIAGRPFPTQQQWAEVCFVPNWAARSKR